MTHSRLPWTFTTSPYEDGTMFVTFRCDSGMFSKDGKRPLFETIMRLEDALLIAAAPDLLAIVKAVWDEATLGGDEGLYMLLTKLDAEKVIARAEGKEVRS